MISFFQSNPSSTSRVITISAMAKSNDNSTISRLDFVPSYKSALLMFLITSIGIFGNVSLIIAILSQKRLRKMSNTFILHQCLLNLVQCLICIPFINAMLMGSDVLQHCHLLGSTYIITVTANLFNLSVVCASEAYKFETFKQMPSNRESARISKNPLACSCVWFGLLMIWFTSIVLHSGITLIASDATQFYNYEVGNCFFVIGNRQAYIHFLMWISITVIALLISLNYMINVYVGILKYKQVGSLYAKTGTYSSLTGNRKEFFKIPKSSVENGIHPNVRLDESKEESQEFNGSSDTKGSTKSCFLTKLRPLVDQDRRLMMHILKRIETQILIACMFVLCWSPFVLATAIDVESLLSSNDQRILAIVAFSNSSLTPFCYLTTAWSYVKAEKARQNPSQNMPSDRQISKYYHKFGSRFHMAKTQSYTQTIFNEQNDTLILKTKEKNSCTKVR